MSPLQQQRALEPPKSNKALIAIASRADAVGKTGRNANGTLVGFDEWAAKHPQRQLTVTIKGRLEWSSAQEGKLSVVSWNLLSDTWFRKEKASGDYAHTSEEHGEWEFRLPRMLEWFRSLNAEVITLQEVDYVLFEHQLLPAMKELGYDGVVQKPKKMSTRQPCGNATFWKSSVLQLESSAVFSRSMATVLSYIHNSNRICVVNVHLESAQSIEGADRRARQLQSPLEWASRFETSLPLVVSGDCNTGADAALFTVLRDYEWHGHALASVYEHPAAENSMAARHATFCVPGHQYLIDHMWYSHDTLKLEHVLEPLTAEEREVVLSGGIPNEICPSDHVPIGAVFELVDQPADCEPATKTAAENTAELSCERKETLENRYQELMASAPVKPKGKPSPETIASLKEHAAIVKAWIRSLEDEAEREFAEALRKNRS